MLSPILATSDVDASIAFYTQKLGFEHAWSMPPTAAGRTEFACVRLADTEVLLGVTEGFVEPEDMAKRGTGIELYIGLPTDFDLDGLYERAKTAGVIITRPLEDRDWGERAFHFKDPDGYRFMLAKPLPK
jgi:uncharacterized glyoxalase superfamily protein PhnB